MVFGVVANHGDSSTGARAYLTQKLPKCLGVENLLLPEQDRAPFTSLNKSPPPFAAKLCRAWVLIGAGD
jgi:hypothetical protein